MDFLQMLSLQMLWHDCRKGSPVPPALQNLTQHWAPVNKTTFAEVTMSKQSTSMQDEYKQTKVIRKGKSQVGAHLEGQDVPSTTITHGSTSCNPQQVRVNNSFSELIPFEYKVNDVDQPQDCSSVPLDDP